VPLLARARGRRVRIIDDLKYLHAPLPVRCKNLCELTSPTVEESLSNRRLDGDSTQTAILFGHDLVLLYLPRLALAHPDTRTYVDGGRRKVARLPFAFGGDLREVVVSLRVLAASEC
jgi:hypothetical protein